MGAKVFHLGVFLSLSYLISARNTHEDEVYYFDKGELCIKNSWFTLFFCVLFFVSACQIIIGVQLLRDKKPEVASEKHSAVKTTDSEMEMTAVSQLDDEEENEIVLKGNSETTQKKKAKKSKDADKIL